jgi:hypothetical protein
MNTSQECLSSAGEATCRPSRRTGLKPKPTQPVREALLVGQQLPGGPAAVYVSFVDRIKNPIGKLPLMFT